MFGLRQLLLVAAVVLFVIAAIGDDPGDWLFWGLAAMAAGLVVEELGFNQRWGTRRTM
jgi:hypothetical protein